MKWIIIILILAKCTILYAPVYKEDPEIRKAYLQMLKIQEENLIDSLISVYNDHIQKLLSSHIHWESWGNAKAWNKMEDAVGILQITKRKVNAINMILIKQGRTNLFTYSDRWNPGKSIEMWMINMNHSNPTFNIRKSCLIWNGYGKDGKGSLKHYNKIKSYYEKL